MPLAQEQITGIAQEVIRTYPRPLELVGVMASEGGSNRVEIMVTVKGCHDAPCRLMLNLSRGDRAALESELRRKLQELLRSHTVPA
jgi:hypothetical protein